MEHGFVSGVVAIVTGIKRHATPWIWVYWLLSIIASLESDYATIARPSRPEIVTDYATIRRAAAAAGARAERAAERSGAPRPQAPPQAARGATIFFATKRFSMKFNASGRV